MVVSNFKTYIARNILFESYRTSYDHYANACALDLEHTCQSKQGEALNIDPYEAWVLKWLNMYNLNLMNMAQSIMNNKTQHAIKDDHRKHVNTKWSKGLLPKPKRQLSKSPKPGGPLTNSP